MNTEEIIIKTTNEEDLPYIMRLWNDGDVMQYVGFPEGLGISMPGMQDWLRRIMRPPGRCHYSIYLSDGTYCGETFYSVDTDTGIAAMDIKLAKASRGRGIATYALSFAVNQAFRIGQATRVYVEPHPDNSKAWSLYKRLGFVSKPRPKELSEEASTYLEITRDAWLNSSQQNWARVKF